MFEIYLNSVFLRVFYSGMRGRSLRSIANLRSRYFFWLFH